MKTQKSRVSTKRYNVPCPRVPGVPGTRVCSENTIVAANCFVASVTTLLALPGYTGYRVPGYPGVGTYRVPGVPGGDFSTRGPKVPGYPGTRVRSGAERIYH
eukprot:2729090-Rhodomonas_salina.1